MVRLISPPNDYALHLFYLTTGMRRAAAISLGRRDVEIEGSVMMVSGRVEGGDYQSREVGDPSAREALLDYLRASRRPGPLRGELLLTIWIDFHSSHTSCAEHSSVSDNKSIALWCSALR